MADSYIWIESGIIWFTSICCMLPRFKVFFQADFLAVVFVAFCHFPNVSWSTSELRQGWCRETGLSPPVKCFTDRSKPVLLLWIFYAFSVLRLLCLCACLFVCALWLPAGVEDWSLGSSLWCLTVSLSLSDWCPGPGVVLDGMESWSLHPYLFFILPDLNIVEN